MCALGHPSCSAQSSRETFGWPNFGHLALSLRYKAGLAVEPVERARQFLPGGFHSTEGRVLCWVTWPARNSSLGIGNPPGQTEDTVV